MIQPHRLYTQDDVNRWINGLSDQCQKALEEFRKECCSESTEYSFNDLIESGIPHMALNVSVLLVVVGIIPNSKRIHVEILVIKYENQDSHQITEAAKIEDVPQVLKVALAKANKDLYERRLSDIVKYARPTDKGL
jgi:hypothetical protein